MGRSLLSEGGWKIMSVLWYAEIFYVDVRYYSDIARFGEAFTVRYTFDRVASVYGLVLYGIEKINDNGYTPCGFTS